MKYKDRPVTFQLVGGLGNQLFIYFAGRYLEDKSDLSIRFDLHLLDQGFTRHGSSIGSLSLPGTFGNFKPMRIGAIWSSGLQYLGRRFPGLHGFVRKYSIYFDSNVVGFNEHLTELSAGKYVRGYFQSYKYALDLVASEGFSIHLNSPSLWFKSKQAEAQRERPIFIHVRRGDYNLLSDSFGLLSASYFTSSLEEVKKRVGSNVPVWVLSDDISSVKQEFDGLFSDEFVWIEPPANSDAAESLLLMTLGSANIISNSTFSWWSAMLNAGSVVAAPSKWFRGMEDPEGLIPPNWMRIESDWKN